MKRKRCGHGVDMGAGCMGRGRSGDASGKDGGRKEEVWR